MNHTCLSLPSRSWYSFTDPGGMEDWVGLWKGFEPKLTQIFPIIGPRTEQVLKVVYSKVNVTETTEAYPMTVRRRLLVLNEDSFLVTLLVTISSIKKYLSQSPLKCVRSLEAVRCFSYWMLMTKIIFIKKHARWQLHPYPHSIPLKRRVSILACGVVC